MDRNDLLNEFQHSRREPRGEIPDCRALVRTATASAPVVSTLQTVEKFLPARADEDLTDFSRFALLGVCVGFSERNLSPYVDAHLEIIPPLLEDIRSVYEQLKKMAATIDRDEFRFRAYDYGIHKACYLDWRLYLSKEMY